MKRSKSILKGPQPESSKGLKLKKLKSLAKDNLGQELGLLDKNKLILHERAVRLAVGTTKVETDQENIEVIAFDLSSETYAFETSYVNEVHPLKNYTRIPGLPEFVLGLVNVRGHIFSVIDLRKFFGLPEKGLDELNKVIFLQDEQMEFGILADNIQGILSFPLGAIQKKLPDTLEIGSKYIKGITPDHLIILDAKKILEDEAIIIDQSN